MANKIPGHIEFAGDYALDSISIHTHFGERIDIKKVVIELNIYESIYKNALTGSIVIGDSQNLVGKLELNGTERISNYQHQVLNPQHHHQELIEQ